MIERKVVGMLFVDGVMLSAGLALGWAVMSGFLSLIEKFAKRYIHFED